MGNHNITKGTPLSNDIKLHNQIGNIQTDNIVLSKALFENAEQFMQVSNIISGANLSFLSPLFTNLAFSCELYLKSILFYNKKSNSNIWGHKLNDLFNMLAPNMKEEIREIATTKYHIEQFDKVLEEVNQTFEFARYLHERKSACFTTELYGLTLAIRESAKCFYNLEIKKHNNIEREKLNNHISTSKEALKFWINYDINEKRKILIISKLITENLCNSLKKDLASYEINLECDIYANEESILLQFNRLNYIYGFEYNNIMKLCLYYFKKFDIQNKGLRTNGIQIYINNEVK